MGAISYDDIEIRIEAHGVAEHGKVPSDSELVKYVWEKTNAEGTPDRRYKNNRQSPVMKYGNIKITSKTGFDIEFFCSNENKSSFI
ncbi:MAG: hypothetical protein KBT01_02330 [Clostridiales bacterium]|nr:hypothetical protein [Candidatus Blautia equi]